MQKNYFRYKLFRRFQYYSLACVFAKTLVFKINAQVSVANATCRSLGSLLLKWKKIEKKKKKKKLEKVELTDSFMPSRNRLYFCRKTLSAAVFHQLCHQAASLSPLHAVIAFPSVSSAGHGAGHKQSNHILVFSPRHRQLWWVESTCLLLTRAVM